VAERALRLREFTRFGFVANRPVTGNQLIDEDLMKKTKIIQGLALILLVGMTACGSLTHHKDEAVIGRVKRVAIVGFSVVEPAPAGIGLNLNSGKTEGVAGGSLISEHSSNVDQMYEGLAKAFHGNMAWEVVPYARLKKNATYRKLFDQSMKGWHNRMPTPSGHTQFLVDGVMDNQSLRILGVDGRNELIRDLGVDAIVTAQVDVLLSGTTVMGIGSRYPQAQLSFQLFTPDKNSPDWFEGGIEGERASTSVGKTGFFNAKELDALAVPSARSAFAKIGKGR